MGVVPGTDYKVERNGSVVRFKSGSFSYDSARVGVAWDIELADPLDIDPVDTWTITRTIGGYSQTIVSDVLATSWDGGSGTGGLTRRVSGDTSTDTDALMTYCIPKTIVFVNPDWLRKTNSAAILKGGIIQVGSGTHYTRYFHPRLPGRDILSTDYTCVVGCRTHHEIGKHLAQTVGYDLVATTPDVDLVDVFTVQSGTTWMDAITRNFQIWSPQIRQTADTIYILDQLTEDLESQQLQTITLTNAAIADVSFTRNTNAAKGQIVDHVIVTGRKTENTLIPESEDPDYTPIEIPEQMGLDVSRTVTVSIDTNKMDRYKQMGGFASPFGLPGNQVDPKKIKTINKTITYHEIVVPNKPSRLIPLEDTTEFLNTSDVVVGKNVTEYRYSAEYKPIRTIESVYAYTNMPGLETKALEKVQVKTTRQDQFVAALNQALTTEMIEDVVLYTKVTKDGTDYKVGPQILADLLRQDYSAQKVSSNPDTKQETLEMTTHFKQTQISRENDEMLVKRDLDFNVLAQAFKAQSQILQNPLPQKNGNRSDVTFRREFHDGTGKMFGEFGPCYHAPKTISHEDITTDEMAEALADRAFARFGAESDQTDVTVKTTMIIPVDINAMAVVMVVPDWPIMVNGVSTTIPGGSYLAKKMRERFAYKERTNGVVLECGQEWMVSANY